MKTINMTPTMAEYRNMLEVIANNSTKPDDREWAKSELKRYVCDFCENGINTLTSCCRHK